jgi:hypothetical protein
MSNPAREQTARPFPISIRSAAAAPAVLLARVEHRVQTALRRFGAHIRAVRVHLADVNGPRGGVDKECTIAIRLAVTPRLLLIEDVDRVFLAAVDRAADRAGHAVARAVHATNHRGGWAFRHARG